MVQPFWVIFMNYIIWYCDGYVVKITPEPQECYYDHRDIIYGADSIVSDGVHYDLTDKKSIYSIAIPNYQIHVENRVSQILGVTGALDYTLRMRAGLYWKQGNYDLSIACLGKATQLMKYSDVGWPKKDFYRIVDWLEQLGRFEKAKEWATWIDNNIITIGGTYDYDPAKKYLDEAKKLSTDLVYIDWHGGSCAVCAKYQGRVYSISGTDKRFPVLPEFIKKTGEIHDGCCHCIRPYIFWNDKKLDTIYYKGKNVCAFKASWRPFVDDRSQEEKNVHSQILIARKKQAEAAIAKHVYCRLKYLIPDDLPKSLGAFSKMKNANTEKYRKLVEKAELVGFKFPQMFVIIEEPIDSDPSYSGGRRKPLLFL